MIAREDSGLLVKICGIQTVEAAQLAIDNGTFFVGIICVPDRKRTVDPKIAKEISRITELARKERESNGKQGPFLVGVFRNQSVQEVQKLRDEYGLDLVQLHGSEKWREYKKELGATPLIKRFIYPEDCPEVLELSNSNDNECLALFDSEAGGTGEKLDWSSISAWSESCGARFVLAGGLTPENVEVASKLPGVIGVDVSGGVETEGIKDEQKIRNFISRASFRK